MALLDKIIMLADFIEPTREDYPGLKKMREQAYVNINQALLTGINETIKDNKNRGRPIHPWSRDAVRCLRKGRSDDE